MISCTEFIPLYSELFKYIEEKSGRDALVHYWHHISDVYVRPILAPLAKQKGLAGCYEYWTRSLNEEAADFVMTYDDETNELFINMRHCPSCGMLNNFSHIDACDNYCGHCAALYAPIMAEYGIECDNNFTFTKNASCTAHFFKK